MSDHKLLSGLSLIEGVVKLGQVLGYHVEEEFPVDEPIYGESPAVDVAWFSKKGNHFPLFIFEVESRATNGMTNNPLKVYSQGNRSFEKPLFYFHVVAKGGSNSSRPRNLEAQYGKNNYRIYLVGDDNATILIQDVLSQHARVKNEINYILFHTLLCSDLWKGKLDHVFLIKHAASLELSKESIIASYVSLSRIDDSLFPSLLSLIVFDAEVEFVNTHLNTYMGRQWFIPILCSMMVGVSDEPNDSDKWSLKLLDWQNNSSYMPMITPAFGLSRDYDEFILGYAPQLITLCIVLSAKKGKFYSQLVNVLEETIDKIGVCWGGLNPSLYLLHISANLELTESFEKARNYLREFGTLSEVNIYQPPSVMSVMEGNFEDYFHSAINYSIPSMVEFSKVCQSIYKKREKDIETMALRALDDDSYLYEWSIDILSALWSSDSNF